MGNPRALKVRIAALVGPVLIRVLGSTLRIRIVNPEFEERARRGSGRVIYAFWHGGMFLPAYTHRGREIGVLTSRHADGDISTSILERLGFRAIRGSTRRGGAAGLLGLIEYARTRDLGITPDGPRGPRGVVQPGVAFLSREAGTPVLPAGIAARPAWRLRSWDRFTLPRPFARCAIAFAEAVEVPPEAGEAEIRVWARRIEERIREAQALACSSLGLPPETYD